VPYGAWILIPDSFLPWAVPLSRRVQALLEPYFALNEKWFIGPRQAQKVVKRVAERARSVRFITVRAMTPGCSPPLV